MDGALLDQAVELLEKANTDLQPELLSAAFARELLGTYARLEKLAAFGVASLARKVENATDVARATGTSMGRAKAAVATGKVLSQSDDLTMAFQRGDVSIDQAVEIASAEESAPGCAAELLVVAESEPFHVLKEKSRKAKLEAEQHNDLFARQRAARSGRSYSDELGMVHIHLALEPHVGTPIGARAEAEAQRQARAAKAKDQHEPFERHLADAYASLLSGSGKAGRSAPS
jgi:hypothetical protein